MSFVKELKIINEKPSRNNQRSIYDTDIPGGIRHCKWIEIDDKNALSIQASEFHYCIPRGLVSLDKYTHFEMALIYKGCLTTDFSILSDFEKLYELMECEDCGIFREVPKELIQDLYEHLKGRFSLHK